MTKHLGLIWTIATNNYKEAIREKLLYGILVVALLATGVSFFLATVSLGQDGRVLHNIGLEIIHVVTLLIVIFVATSSIHKDFERRALYFLFPKPINRSHYIIGKFIGLCLLLITTLLILGGLFSIGLIFTDRSLIPAVFYNLCFSFLEISLLGALAILLSSFTAPLNAALYTGAFFIIGHSLVTLKEFAERSSGPLVQNLISTCYYILPNLEKFNIRPLTLYQLPIHLLDVGLTIVYWLVYTCFVLGLAIMVINKQEV